LGAVFDPGRGSGAPSSVCGAVQNPRVYMTDVFFAPGAWAVFFVAIPWAASGSEATTPRTDAPRFLSTIFAGPFQNAKKAVFQPGGGGLFLRVFSNSHAIHRRRRQSGTGVPHSKTLRAQRAQPMRRQVLDPVPACLSEPVHKFTHTLSKPMPAFLQLSGGVRLRRSARGGLIPRRIFGRGRLACPGNRRSGRNPGW